MKMDRIIEAVEEKLQSQETTIYIQQCEIERLKKELAAAENFIKNHPALNAMHCVKGEQQ